MPRHFEVPRFKRGGRLRAESLNKVAKAAEFGANAELDPRWFPARREGAYQIISLATRAVINLVFSWIVSRQSFGYRINNANGTVTIKAGRFNILGQSEEINDTTVTINGGTTANPHYVYARAPVQDLSQAEIPTPALSSYPLTAQNYHVKVLWAFSKVNNTIRMVRDHRTDVHVERRN